MPLCGPLSPVCMGRTQWLDFSEYHTVKAMGCQFWDQVIKACDFHLFHTLSLWLFPWVCSGGVLWGRSLGKTPRAAPAPLPGRVKAPILTSHKERNPPNKHVSWLGSGSSSLWTFRRGCNPAWQLDCSLVGNPESANPTTPGPDSWPPDTVQQGMYFLSH